MRNESALPRQFLEELYVHRCACLLTLKLPNCEGKTCSVFLLPLFHLLRSIWGFLNFFFKASEALLRWNLPPPSVFLSGAWDFASYCKLQEMREEKISPMGEHPVHLAPAAGPSWTLHHVSHPYTGYKCLFYCFFPSQYKDSSLSTPLFTHSPSTTPQQTELGEFISV